jgi:iron uptake system component EfeO
VVSAPADATAGASASPGIVITVTLTNEGCTPNESKVPAGPTTFKVVNDGADKVSELELSRAGQTVGEKEDLAPGMSASFVVDLSPGEYILECPGAVTDETPLQVTSG